MFECEESLPMRMIELVVEGICEQEAHDGVCECR